MTYSFIPGRASPSWGAPVATAGDLPATAADGDVAVALDTGVIYVYDGAAWITSSGGLTAVTDTNSVDLTNTIGSVSADLRLSATAPGAGYTAIANDIQVGGSPGLRSRVLNTDILALLSATDTDSIDQTFSGGAISADLRLSATAAGAGYTAIANDIQGGGSPGLRSRVLNTDVFALFSATDTDSIDQTFSGGAISAGLRLSAAAADAANFLAPADIQSGGSPGLRVQVPHSAVRGLLSATAPAAYSNVTGVISWAGSLDDLTALIAGGVAGAGKIGETLTATQAANTATGVGLTGAWGNAISLAINAGEWAIEGIAGLAENGATLTTSLSSGISTSSSGVGIGGFDYVESPFLVSGAADLQMRTPTLYVSVAGATTYYLNTRFFYTAGSPQHRGRLTARRIR
jgi:hypothetical protein